jgi:flagellar protein FlgJ
MTAPVSWADPRAVTANEPTVREAARQFESLFLRLMLKSMREASMGDELFDSHAGGFYRDMFDDQIAVEMSGDGGFGLAEVLVRQLQQVPQTTPTVVTSSIPEGARDGEPLSRERFVSRLWPVAQAAGRELGVDPRHVIAHAALETGWGRSLPQKFDGESSFNLFGIKANARWRGETVTATTHEFLGGTMQRRQEPFRSYPSIEASVADYAQLLGSSPRYAAVRGTGTNSLAFAQGLQAAGYATDPDYANKLHNTVKTVSAMLPADSSSNSHKPITASQ